MNRLWLTALTIFIAGRELHGAHQERQAQRQRVADFAAEVRRNRS